MASVDEYQRRVSLQAFQYLVPGLIVIFVFVRSLANLYLAGGCDVVCVAALDVRGEVTCE